MALHQAGLKKAVQIQGWLFSAMAAARVPTQSPPQEGHGGHRRFPIQCPFLPFPITEPHLYRRQCWARPQACFSGRLTPSSHLTTSGQWEASRSKSPETSERVFTFLIQKIQPEPPLPFLAYKHMSHLQVWQLSCDPEAMSMGTKTSFLRNCLVTTSTPTSAQTSFVEKHTNPVFV